MNPILSGGHPQFHDASSEQAHHPLKLARPSLWPRHTRLHYLMHQLSRHLLVGISHRVGGSRFLALLPLRLPAASTCRVCLSGAPQPGVRAHGEGEGAHRQQAVAAPDTCALQKLQRDNRWYSRMFLYPVSTQTKTARIKSRPPMRAGSTWSESVPSP